MLAIGCPVRPARFLDRGVFADDGEYVPILKDRVAARNDRVSVPRNDGYETLGGEGGLAKRLAYQGR